MRVDDFCVFVDFGFVYFVMVYDENWVCNVFEMVEIA